MHERMFGSGWPGAGWMSVLMQFEVGHSRAAVTIADMTAARTAATFRIRLILPDLLRRSDSEDRHLFDGGVQTAFALY